MTQFAYLFERFPSFGQTFCYREVAELARQGIAPPIFAIRNPKDEPSQDWDQRIVERVHYLPDEEELLREVHRASKKGKLPGEVTAALDQWRSEEHTSELQSHSDLVCRLLLEKKKKNNRSTIKL